MTKAIHVIIFAFIVGGLVGYGIATTQALNNAVFAAADTVSKPDARQVELVDPTPIQPCYPTPTNQSTAVTPMTTADPTGQ